MNNTSNKAFSRSKLVITFMCLMTLMSCARKDDGFAAVLKAQGTKTVEIGKQWERGEDLEREGRSMIERGQSKIKKGEKVLSEGNKLVAGGKSKIADGARLKEESMSAYKKHMSSLEVRQNVDELS